MSDEAASAEPTLEWYAPNQQAVRGDGSGPAEEGEGGSPPAEEDTVGEPRDLDAMTKDQLMDYADEHGVEYQESWTKAQIREAIGA